MDTIIELGKVTEETLGEGGDRYENLDPDECDTPEVLSFEVGIPC